MFACLAILACTATSPQLIVRAVDATTGRPLEGFTCGLVRRGEDTTYARFDGTDYTGTALPRAGDHLYVYRRGYDVRIVTLPDDHEELTVRLHACVEPCSLRLAGRGVDKAESVVQVMVRAPGKWRESPVRDSYEVRATGARIRLPVSRGTDTRGLVRARPGLAWPPLLDLAPGTTAELRYDAPRELPVRCDADLRLDVACVECLPDRLWSPVGEPDRIDAWRWRLNGPDWLRAPFAEGKDTIGVAPVIPFHLFASVAGRGVYRYVPRDAGALDLRGPFRSRELVSRPVVDGKPVRAGAWIAPGRLDLHAVSSLAQLSGTLPGCVAQAGPADAAWSPVSLPAAAWLTVWHPDSGLAHLEWGDDAPPSGRTAAGRIVLRVPPSCGADGYVSVFPVWRGTGAVVIVPPDRLLRRRVTRQDRAVTFRGLPPGRYGLDVRVMLTAAGTAVRRGRTWRVGRTLEVEVTAERPLRRVLPMR